MNESQQQHSDSSSSFFIFARPADVWPSQGHGCEPWGARANPPRKELSTGTCTGVSEKSSQIFFSDGGTPTTPHITVKLKSRGFHFCNLWNSISE